MYDVVVVGGGPAGLAASLILGRARKRVLLCDAGSRRNAAAKAIQGFVSRDGTAPDDFRRIARDQLGAYASVSFHDGQVLGVAGTHGAFDVRTAVREVRARRVLLCTGLVDELPDVPGCRDLWGKAIFQCPYCHGWEVRDQTFGYLAPTPEWVDWALLLRGWTTDVVVFTNGAFAVPAEVSSRLAAHDVKIEERRVRRIVSCADHGACGNHLEAIELEDGQRIARQALFVRPRQRQTDLVKALDLTLDQAGFVVVSDRMETSRAGVYAAGDLTTLLQGALVAAAAGAKAAYILNHDLTSNGVVAGSAG